jgi:hypothetical protein
MQNWRPQRNSLSLISGHSPLTRVQRLGRKDSQHLPNRPRGGTCIAFITVGDPVGKFCANSQCGDPEKRLSALESEIRSLKSLLFSKESSFKHKIRKNKAEGEIRTRVVAPTGPLPLPTAQMCHKASFDLSCRTG